MYEPESGRKVLFRCGRWLDRGEDDKETVRELPAVSGGLYPTPLPGNSLTSNVPLGSVHTRSMTESKMCFLDTY